MGSGSVWRLCFLLDVIGFNAAISACEKGGQWQRVAPMLDEKHSRGMLPNMISFIIIIIIIIIIISMVEGLGVMALRSEGF